MPVRFLEGWQQLELCMKEKGQEKQVPESHTCDVCGEKAVCIDSPDTLKDTNHWHCLKHHQDWCRCITHVKQVAEWQRSKDSTLVK